MYELFSGDSCPQVQYSRRWQYDFNESKTKYLTHGHDTQPGIVIIMDGVPIEVVDSYKHVGLTLCSNRPAMRQTISKRISSAQSKLLAARGIGSHKLPVGVGVLSKIYWSVVMPSLTYGLDVQPIEECDIDDLEKAHRKNAKIVQSISHLVATPSVYAPIGWMSMRGFIYMNRLLFLIRLLCMSSDNIYKRFLVFRLNEIFINGYVTRTHKSPIDCMYEALCLYKLDEKLKTCMQTGELGSMLEWKKIIKKIAWSHEYVQWRASCFLYNNLTEYSCTIVGIKIHNWWKISNLCPNLYKRVGGLMSVLMGSQPPGMLCNFDSNICQLCRSRNNETILHVLFGCQELGILRHELLNNIIDVMPNAMKHAYTNMTVQQKLLFLLSPLNCNFNHEWINIYRNILIFVCKMYSSRKEKYDLLEQRQ